MISRRKFLGAATLPVLASWTAPPAAAQSQPLEVDIGPLLDKLTGGKPLTKGRVQITAPAFADNGQSVPLTVSVAVGEAAVKSLHLFAPRNPRPNIANFYFGPRAGKASVTTRVRLAGTQSLRVVAAFADGSFGLATAAVEVTASACLDMSAS